MAQEEPYARWMWNCGFGALFHMHDSEPFFFLFAFFFALLRLVCVKAARHNKPSAQLTGASAETFTYDIVKLLCNQSLLIWDTIVFSRPRRPSRQPRRRQRKSHQIQNQRISKPIFYFGSSFSRAYICTFMGNSKQTGSACPIPVTHPPPSWSQIL